MRMNFKTELNQFIK